MVKAKFICISKEQNINGGRVSLEPVTAGSDENKSFWKYTPSGKLEMYIDNDAAFGEFHVGTEYYLDITPAS